MYKVILTLDKCFLKYEGRGTGEGGEGGQIDPPKKKLPSKSSALFGLRTPAINLEKMLKIIYQN